MKEHVKLSIDGSLYAQGASLLVNFFGLAQQISPIHAILKQVLKLETVVQIIELIFYLWYRHITHTSHTNLDITRFRYYDWIVTTPMMLFSTIGYYAYKKQLQTQSAPVDLFEVWNSNKTRITIILILNALMLAFGYLQEIGVIDITTSSILGYFALCGSFYGMYDGFVKDVEDKRLFYFMFIIWSFYGIAAMYPNAPKNIAYNILDVFAKNFYGIYLSYILYSIRELPIPPSTA
jgi:hypothetical protein